MPGKKGSAALALCVNHCSYYKPGGSEELACQGFIVAERLITGGRKLSLGKKKRVKASDARIDDGLHARMCRLCDFREADCDFILTGGRAEPCGGYSLLFRLLADGELTLDDIGPSGK